MPTSVKTRTPSSPTPVDPDDAILDLHFVGNVVVPVFVLAEVLGNAGDGGDVMKLVDVHRHAA